MNNFNQSIRRGLCALFFGLIVLPANAETYSFGVLSQRSPTLTAEHWNPVLSYISAKTGVDLRLRISRTAPESNDAISTGQYDFVYSNTIFTPENAKQGYRVILRPKGEPIRAQIVTLQDSPIHTLANLEGLV